MKMALIFQRISLSISLLLAVFSAVMFFIDGVAVLFSWISE